MKLITDTSILIDFLRGGEAGTNFFNQIKKQEFELLIPTIIIFELFSGKSAENPTVLKKITNFLASFKRIELTEAIAIRAGQLYRQTGRTLGPQDYIIAASALEINATVVTLNTKHFGQIPNLNIYPL
jgi:predicted nucleic acid-binding protein